MMDTCAQSTWLTTAEIIGQAAPSMLCGLAETCTGRAAVISDCPQLIKDRSYAGVTTAELPGARRHILHDSELCLAAAAAEAGSAVTVGQCARSTTPPGRIRFAGHCLSSSGGGREGPIRPDYRSAAVAEERSGYQSGG
jgi:hypothetical protein